VALNGKTVVNPLTGARYKVESGPNQYWMDSTGHCISSDDPAYDPNLDKTLNHRTWEELKKSDYVRSENQPSGQLRTVAGNSQFTQLL
jgi:hypothetical protein